jgi:hypothetical protein
VTAVVPEPPGLVLFLDECVPAIVGDRLITFLGDRPERPSARHLLTAFPRGTPDRQWLEVVKASGWLLVTADRGKSNRGEKLPRLCLEMGVIHIVFSATLHARPANDRALALAAVWLDIVDVWQNRIGCGHVVRVRDRGKGFKLVDKATNRTRRPLGPP